MEKKPNNYKSKDKKKESLGKPRYRKPRKYLPKPKSIGKWIHGDQDAVKIIPLGGLGEVGRNLTVLCYQDEWIIVDVGLLFPDESYIGIDFLIPDFSFIEENKEKIKAIIITHGHEDHIGALPFLYPHIPQVPIFAPPLAAELIILKFKRFEIPFSKSVLHRIEKKTWYPISSSFEIEFVEVQHSIPDSFGLIIKTPVGTIVHTGDFKVDFYESDHTKTDLNRFAQAGNEGVHLLMSDSTNVQTPFNNKSEKQVMENLTRILFSAKGRVIIGSFASNIIRMSELAKIAAEQGRKIVILGLSFETNFEIARRLKYLKLSTRNFIQVKDLSKYPKNKILIITTGSQGEPLSALYKISQDTHSHVRIEEGDTVILSASIIPGNEKSVTHVVNSILKKNAQVFYARNSDTHVSGHGSAENLLLMLHLTQPKFFMPVHGEQQHLLAHRNLAIQCQVPEKNIVIAENGNIVQLTKDSFKIEGKRDLESYFVENGKVYLDSFTVSERKKLATDGILAIFVYLRKDDNKVLAETFVETKGIPASSSLKELVALVKENAQKASQDWDINKGDRSALKRNLQASIYKILHHRLKKQPLVLLEIVFSEDIHKKPKGNHKIA